MLSEKMIDCATRLARANGVTVEVVLSKYRHAVRKSAFSIKDFFWPVGDISLNRADSARGKAARRLPGA